MNEKENNKTITPEQIEAWKKKWGDVFCVTVGDKVAYLKRPSRQALSAAAVVGKNDPMKYNEILLNNCWLAGDEEIKIDDSLFLGVSAKLGELVEVGPTNQIFSTPRDKRTEDYISGRFG